MLATGLVAIDATILATAVPSVVDDLGGFAQFPWLFSIYLLAQAVSTPIFGKLSDVYGRRPMMLVGIGLFLLGSILCGVAWGMPALIVFRALQGLGAGAVQPIAMTIVGDLYSVAERAKVQGYVASVWGISSVVGPTLGGVFSDFLSWRWIFFVNIPVGALAAIMLVRHYSETVESRKRSIDVTGAILLALGSSLVILGLLEGGVLWSWLSAPSVVVLGAGGALLVGFGLVERRAREPILPGWVLTHRVLASTNLTSLAVGAVLIGLTSYIPLYVQGVLGTSALVAGFALAAMTLGWPLAASQAGRLYLRVGFQVTAGIGALFVLAGAGLLLLIGPGTGVAQVAATCFVLGLGMGLIASPTLVAAQAVVDRGSRGVVTGTNMFARSMGSAVGIAVFGAIANHRLGTTVGSHGGTANDVPANLLDPAVHDVFLAAGVVAVLMTVAITSIPRRIELMNQG
ncbi:MAG: MDR family MFS transporter [Propionibacteriaceae bacterium]